MTLSRTLCSLLAVGLLWLTNGPALSRTPNERVELILSKLPPKGGSAYRALRIFAGNSPVQVLTLTKMEVWSLPHSRVAAVKRASARFGVRVDELALDWNHVLRPVPAPTNISDDRKAERTDNTPRAPTEMSMVLPPRAAMVEYALTKDAREKASPGKPAKIVVRLNETTVLTLTRASVEIGDDMCTWHGTVDDTDAPATIMWWPGVAMAGIIRHYGRLYSIRRSRGARWPSSRRPRIACHRSTHQHRCVSEQMTRTCATIRWSEPAMLVNCGSLLHAFDLPQTVRNLKTIDHRQRQQRRRPQRSQTPKPTLQSM